MYRQPIRVLAVAGIAIMVAGCPAATCLEGECADSSAGTEVPVNPAFVPFEIEPATGAYWDFAWYKTSSASSGSVNAGIFRLRLGAPRMIDGVTTHEVLLEGYASQFRPRWQYLAFDGARILGSSDGVSLAAVFDGHHGSWPGGGFFFAFSEDELMRASETTLNNGVYDGAAIVVQRSGSEGGCEYFPGVGTICPSEHRESFTQKEYYHPSVGPLAFYKRGCSSGRYAAACVEFEGSLIGHGTEAGDDLVPLEIEPNDEPGSAQPIPFGKKLLGWVHSSDTGSVLQRPTPEMNASIEAIGVPDLLTATFADWYTFEVTERGDVTVTLDFSEPRGTPDLDLVLFEEWAVVDASLADNLRESEWQWFETVTVSLEPGRYYIAVWAFRTDDRVVSYTVSVE